jgi:hypothetical protein
MVEKHNNTTSQDILLARLAEGLDSTAKLTQALLSDLRDSETDFAAFKAELNILKENVKSLSQLIREGDGTSSLLTRVAIIEHRLDNLEELFREMEDQKKEEARITQVSINRELDVETEKKKSEEKVKAEKQSVYIKIVGAVALGIIGLLGGYLTSLYSGSGNDNKPSIDIRVNPVGSAQSK